MITETTAPGTPILFARPGSPAGPIRGHIVRVIPATRVINGIGGSPVVEWTAAGDTGLCAHHANDPRLTIA